VTTSHNIRLLRSALALAVGGLALAGAAPSLSAPEITGADTDVWNAANPDPTYTITASSRRLRIYWEIPGVDSGDDRSPVRLSLSKPADGQYRLIAREGSSVSVTVRQRAFRVDVTPPVVTIRRPVAGERIGQGTAVAADYSCEGALTCVGPVPPGAPLDTSAVGPVSFAVRAVDDAGNEATGLADYVVSAPRTVNARTLRPRAGARLTSRRPVLRWRGRPNARLYNVQVFRLRGTTATKVLSAFPRRARFRVPAKKVAFGERYLWRVWPYLKGGYPDTPLGLSYFDVRAPAADR